MKQDGSILALVLALWLAPGAGSAQPVQVEVFATDAISLAGRSDVAIPAIGGDLSGYPVPRPDPQPSHSVETRPEFVEVSPGEVLTFAASGQALFSPLGVLTGPDGDAPKSVQPVGGISGYAGQGGSLVAVFLDDAIPLSGPPAALDFSSAGIGSGFAALAPALRQVFFIGDGRRGTGSGARQTFTAPPGATRLFFATMDSGGFGEPPGYYTDNTGSFLVTVPEPAAGGLALASVVALALLAWRRGSR